MAMSLCHVLGPHTTLNTPRAKSMRNRLRQWLRCPNWKGYTMFTLNQFVAVVQSKLVIRVSAKHRIKGKTPQLIIEMQVTRAWILYCRGRVWVPHLSLSSGHRRINVLAVADPVFLFVDICKWMQMSGGKPGHRRMNVSAVAIGTETAKKLYFSQFSSNKSISTTNNIVLSLY